MLLSKFLFIEVIIGVYFIMKTIISNSVKNIYLYQAIKKNLLVP